MGCKANNHMACQLFLPCINYYPRQYFHIRTAWTEPVWDILRICFLTAYSSTSLRGNSIISHSWAMICFKQVLYSVSSTQMIASVLTHFYDFKENKFGYSLETTQCAGTDTQIYNKLLASNEGEKIHISQAGAEILSFHILDFNRLQQELEPLAESQR